MRVISERRLREFWEQGHADAEYSLRAWIREAEKADWKSPSGIKTRYAHASILPADRVVFNIGGNKYRLVVHVRYEFHIVFIRWIGTHREYDAIDAGTV